MLHQTSRFVRVRLTLSGPDRLQSSRLIAMNDRDAARRNAALTMLAAEAAADAHCDSQRTAPLCAGGCSHPRQASNHYLPKYLTPNDLRFVPCLRRRRYVRDAAAKPRFEARQLSGELLLFRGEPVGIDNTVFYPERKPRPELVWSAGWPLVA